MNEIQDNKETRNKKKFETCWLQTFCDGCLEYLEYVLPLPIKEGTELVCPNCGHIQVVDE